MMNLLANSLMNLNGAISWEQVLNMVLKAGETMSSNIIQKKMPQFLKEILLLKLKKKTATECLILPAESVQ